jgi:hypothetical protein
MTSPTYKRDPVLAEPALEGVKALGVVGELMDVANAAMGAFTQAHVELEFGDIDAKDMGSQHRMSGSSLVVGAGGSSLAAVPACMETLRSRSGERGSGYGWSLTR